jgi:hypothetical protein
MRAACWIAFSLFQTFSCVETGLSWGAEGHRAIAALATQLLAPATLRRVNNLLTSSGERDLPSISTWADDVRRANRDQGPLRENAEAMAFNRDFPDNANWHFVDLPLGAESYEAARDFGSADDVVHAIGRCVAVLESPEPTPGGMTRIEALRLLVHFVGDIHQPLHCGCGFYDLANPDSPKLITDPKEARDRPNDRGGNLLFYDLENNQELHAFWDTVVVTAIADTSDYKGLVAYLNRHPQFRDIPVTPGQYSAWAEAWSIDSVKCAVQAYRDVRFGPVDSSSPEEPIRIPIILPRGYAELSKTIATHQLFAASVHLAQLLNSIQWPPSQ